MSWRSRSKAVRVAESGLSRFTRSAVSASRFCRLAAASIVSLGYNLTDDPTPVYLDQLTDKINTNPLLAPLADNGGPTQTRALLAGSPAIDAGAFSGSTSDQRGLERPIDFTGIANASDGNDIGAFEYQDELFKDGFGN